MEIHRLNDSSADLRAKKDQKCAEMIFKVLKRGAALDLLSINNRKR